MNCICKKPEITAIKIGNDIEIKWSIFTGSMVDNEPYNLDGKNITVYLKSKCEVEKAKDISVSGNVVTCYFYGKDQRHLGVYSIELVENEGEKGMFSIDENNAFEIVKHTRDTHNNDEGNLSFNTLEFSTAKQINVVINFEVDDSMNLNMTYISNNKITPAFSLGEDGYLTLGE